ncbi:tetratricopeptide repeat protein [Sphingomonas sp. XXL09]|uniref:tetratricopeptide repeat protein n=1 Tax=Sphingomonas sp. XXL09 TaxID=3457787 RepID=UPI00406BDA6C
MPDAVYPMLRPRRTRRRIALPRLAGVRLIAIAILVALAVAIAALALRPHRRVDPAAALADARRAYALGNYSAARNHALTVIAISPREAAAQMLLADSYLHLGDGPAAEGVISRARTAGLPANTLAGRLAAARLLQGDAQGAIDAAGAAPDERLAVRSRARALAVQGDAGQGVRLLAAQLARDDTDGEAWADLGRIRLDAGEIAAASDAIARALRLRPGDPVVLTLSGELTRSRYGLIAALPWFEAALRRDAYFHPALIEYAATLSEVGRNRDMLAATRRALAARPNSPQALYLQAVLAARAGRGEVARDLLQRAGPAIAGLPGATLVGGALDYAGGGWERAIDSWRQLVADQPMNLPARRLLAAALLRSGDAPAAIAMLAPLIARGDADTYALTVAARAYERTGDRATAAQLLDRAASGGRTAATVFASDDGVAARLADAADAPDDPNYWLGVIRAQLTAGDAAGAVQQARTLVVRAPGAPAPLLALGDALVASGRFAEAAAVYARAADLAYDEPTMLRLVDAWGRAGRPRDAAAALSLFLQQNPQNIAGLMLLGHWQRLAGHGDAAIETLEAVRRLAGNRDAALLAELAQAYAGADDGDIARVYGRAAYALAPLSPVAADAYAVALAAAGDLGAARQLAVKARALAPRDSVIAGHAAAILR